MRQLWQIAAIVNIGLSLKVTTKFKFDQIKLVQIRETLSFYPSKQKIFITNLAVFPQDGIDCPIIGDIGLSEKKPDFVFAGLA